jgi:diacylglycerol kinase family enzyme
MMISIGTTKVPLVVVATTSTCIIAAGSIIWIQWNQWRWKRQVDMFSKAHHKYTTTTTVNRKSSHANQHEEKNDVPSSHDVLLIVGPTAGGGKAMKEYNTVIKELEETHGRHVEVYITSSTRDLQTLTDTKDFRPYKMIAVLAGDSTIFELVQSALIQNKGRWPFAPILHLPGGTGNALPNEFYGGTLDIRKILGKANKVRKASAIKVSNGGTDVRYAVHNCFAGVQVSLIDWAERYRAISSAFGAFGLPLVLMTYLLTLPFRNKNVSPIVLNVCNSDYEGAGMRLGFGVNRFDRQMAVITGGPYQNIYKTIKACLQIFTGSLGLAVQDSNRKNKTELPHGLKVEVCDHFVAKGASSRYRLYFDGSDKAPLEGADITFEIIPESIAFFTSGRK